ncbi:hypothetical protein [Bacillus sp. AFS031507]|uniref:hypothetical protein n=1 Tax=Bacillus sp. AFS031507 TaxID=2033496 RepID=UPI000BFE5D4F|nr:hypothetical protein [Bacillus sp. AFS031507]PGY03440.1 hypothetical protein COE25_29690 [Bacillus sp. AFS031507]
MNETKQQGETTEKKSILKILFGDLPFQELLEINTKLNYFDKTINISWYVVLIASFINSFIFDQSVSKLIYMIITIPVLILISLSLIILFRKDFGVHRFICLGCTAFMMLLLNQWIDLYPFIKQDYITIEGIPNKVEKHAPRYGKGYWEVVIDDVKLTLPSKLKEKQMKSGIEIQYLPKSKFIIEYKTKDIYK